MGAPKKSSKRPVIHWGIKAFIQRGPSSTEAPNHSSKKAHHPWRHHNIHPKRPIIYGVIKIMIQTMYLDHTEATIDEEAWHLAQICVQSLDLGAKRSLRSRFFGEKNTHLLWEEVQ
jgi:hypothetical protein